MRKIFLAVMLALGSVFTLCADNVSDVKATITSQYKAYAQGNVQQALSFYADDFQEITSEGKITPLQEIKDMIKMLDGNHPYELIVMATKEQKGGELSQEELAACKEAAKDPEFLAEYQEMCKALPKYLKANGKLTLETLQFKSVEVNGKQAVAVVEYDSLKEPESEETKHDVTTVTLKKINGSWKISKTEDQ